MTTVRVYVEGGGDSKSGRRALREGMHLFLERGLLAVDRGRLALNVRACGRRDAARSAFVGCLSARDDVFAVLLVDSEGPVERTPRQHLAQSDRWDCSAGEEGRYQLMVQAMEAWLLADPEALAVFYGQRFSRGAIRGQQNVEAVPKPDLQASLEKATRQTQKGPYRKLDHGAALLSLIDPSKVRKRAPHCERLFATLARVLEANA